MSFKTRLLPHDVQERKELHAVFNRWIFLASEDEFEQLSDLREQFAPQQVCSVIRLLHGCMQEPTLLSQMPSSLRQLLQERTLLPSCAAAKSP